MLQCIVTAQRLNVRKVLPARLPDPENIIGVVSAGAELEAEEVDASELPDQNLGKWFRDRDGKFYWGGGLLVTSLSPTESKQVVEIDFQEFINQNFDGTVLKDTINYNQLLNLSTVYKDTLGDGLTIALLDTGISPQPLLKNSLLPVQIDYTKSAHAFDDIEGHGTFLSGLISGYSTQPDTIIGIAPKSKIANIKVINDRNYTEGNILMSGLENIKNSFNNCIVNMSLNITYGEYDQLVNSKILDELSINNVCIAAAGENDMLLADGGILFPSSSDKVVAVGTIDKKFFKNNPNPKFDKNLDFIIPQFILVSCGTGSNFVLESGVSSMASAIVSAVTALVFSKKGANQISLINVRNALNSLATPYSEIRDINSLILIKP